MDSPSEPYRTIEPVEARSGKIRTTALPLKPTVEIRNGQAWRSTEGRQFNQSERRRSREQEMKHMGDIQTDKLSRTTMKYDQVFHI